MPSKRHTYTILSGLYLLALTIVAAWALHRTQIHRLPIPITLGAFTLALPAIVGLALESLTGTANNNRTTIRWAPRLGSSASWSQYTITILFILETVLATLAGTYITPAGGLRCALDERWRDLYRQKNAKVIGRIQDAFSCCGLHSPVDMAYPFPSKEVAVDACKVNFGRTRSCFDSLREEERVCAGLMLAVTAGVAIWKILVIYMQARRTGWADDVARDDTGERRALEYHGNEGAYRDQPDVEDVEDSESAPALRVVPSLLRDDGSEVRGRPI